MRSAIGWAIARRSSSANLFTATPETIAALGPLDRA
jgi:hypothetical protein